MHPRCLRVGEGGGLSRRHLAYPFDGGSYDFGDAILIYESSFPFRIANEDEFDRPISRCEVFCFPFELFVGGDEPHMTDWNLYEFFRLAWSRIAADCQDVSSHTGMTRPVINGVTVLVIVDEAKACKTAIPKVVFRVRSA